MDVFDIAFGLGLDSRVITVDLGYNYYSRIGTLSGIWFGVRSGSVRGSFGVRSGSVRANFGPKFPKPKISKFSICAAVAVAAGAL